MSTEIGAVIQPGQTIPEDVLRFRTADDEIAYRNETDGYPWRLVGCENPGTCSTHSADEFEWPLTVTAVREPEPAAKSVSGLCEVGSDKVTCIVMDVDHRRIYHGGRPVPPYASTEALLSAAELEPVDLLDLVRQWRDQCVMLAKRWDSMRTADAERWDATNAALFARIEAEVQRLRGEADASGFLAAVNKLTMEREWARRERDEALATLHDANADRSRLIAEVACLRADRSADDEMTEWSNWGLMQALGVEQLTDVMPAIERLKAAQPDPRVLSLPQVPEGAVALVGERTGQRYTREQGYWAAEGTAPYRLRDLMFAEGSLTVEMAPPREPRTWRDDLAILRDGIARDDVGPDPDMLEAVDRIEAKLRGDEAGTR